MATTTPAPDCCLRSFYVLGQRLYKERIRTHRWPSPPTHQCETCGRHYLYGDRGWDLDPAHAYVCPRCGATSFNRHDIEQRYCARCHQFEEL